LSARLRVPGPGRPVGVAQPADTPTALAPPTAAKSLSRLRRLRASVAGKRSMLGVIVDL
jgi:hypothetical protein